MEKYLTIINQRRWGSTLIYELYSYVLQDRVCFFWFSILKKGIIFAHFGVVFQVRSLDRVHKLYQIKWQCVNTQLSGKKNDLIK